ncbi:MAG: bifunctional serine/threonine-protein kinase/formylglycine-generating enzyme family protein [Planctomycetota bacterium]
MSKDRNNKDGKNNQEDPRLEDESRIRADSRELLLAYLEQQETLKAKTKGDPQQEFPELVHELDTVLDRISRDLLTEGDSENEAPWTLSDFKILSKIGSGGMATVYEAEQLSLKRKVALKVLPPHLRYSKSAIKKFQREAEAGGRQSHPGIVSIYAVGKEDDIYYIAQELIEGGYTLADRMKALKTDRPPSQGYFRDVAEMVLQTAEALFHAHQSGVIHRDVKPSNILITPDNRVKVTDFGLARVEDALALSRTGEFAGTPYYMSPEQLSEKKVEIDHGTDIFSLGVTLYEMLTLKRPFEGETSHVIMKKILLQDPEDPCKVNPRVPRDLAVICLKALEKKRSTRYATMKAFAEDLKRFLTGDVIHAKPAGSLDKLAKRIKRNPALSAALGVAALGVLYTMISIPITMNRLGDERNKAVKAGNEAQRQARLANSRYQEIVRLKDAMVLAQLLDSAETLWPAVPQKIPDMESWLASADELLGRLDEHRATLAALETSLSAAPVDPRSGEIEEEVRTWHRMVLVELIRNLEAFGHEESGKRKEIRDRLQFAKTIYDRSIGNERLNWDRTLAAIVDREKYPIYNGLKLEPQLGLVPLGADPDSGLFEFGHPQTGEVPKRDAEGRLHPDVNTGLVFVLIPGGSYTIGSIKPSEEHKLGEPNVDPYSLPWEQPAHQVTLKPFFLSKYEMTQAQWLHFTHDNPSQYKFNVDGKALLDHPVEYVDWTDCVTTLAKMQMRLPFEAEWEYAARGGTATIWWSGNEQESLAGGANLADRHYYKDTAEENLYYDMWLDDGYTKTAPAFLYRPNGFGLHNVLGNVTEWCFDPHLRTYENIPADGIPAEPANDNDTRVVRGGDWRMKAQHARCACRDGFMIGDLGGYLGVRPARSIQSGLHLKADH